MTDNDKVYRYASDIKPLKENFFLTVGRRPTLGTATAVVTAVNLRNARRTGTTRAAGVVCGFRLFCCVPVGPGFLFFVFVFGFLTHWPLEFLT